MKPQRNHGVHRGILIDKKCHKVFQSSQSISLCLGLSPYSWLWLGCLCVLCG